MVICITWEGKIIKVFFMGPVTPFDILDSVKGLAPKSSAGYDNISNKILKETILEISTPLAHIFNLSFASGKMPINMKVAKTIPIFKSGESSELNNYRPISLLPTISKLLEKIVHKCLMSFLNNNNILHKHQYGFRRKHSTLHPIFHFIKHVTDFNDKRTKDLTIGIFLDLSKAFDTVSHSILLSKLHHYGIRGTSLEWFTSYLSDRTQFTEINGQKSSVAPVKYGVPQGSILGPLLFLLYINDISNATSLNVLSFADDTTLYTSSPSPSKLSDYTNKELNNVFNWLVDNKLSLNISKTKFMLFGPQTSNHDKWKNLTLKINDVIIERVGKNYNHTSLKFLGINLDTNLKFNNHIQFLSNKINKGLFALNQVKHL